MKNSVGFQFLVIMCVCMQKLYAQNNFINTLNHLDKIMVQTQVLRDIVQAEMAKQGIPSGPGAPPPSNVAYSSFVDEVAGRLQILEDSVAGLNNVMNRCHHQPQGNMAKYFQNLKLRSLSCIRCIYELLVIHCNC